ncbi:hypothetical protein [Parafrankia sp. FMc2]|uniref:hypothetical protein n=1 Tax=Parafrankia sp. FMc2 TaxID=3233196 RepID=UPI0034D40E97
MRVTVARSWSLKAHNEDAVGCRADGAWVVDGASALEAGPHVEGLPGAAWVSSLASRYLGNVDWDGMTLPEVLADLIGHLVERGRRAGLTEAGTSRSSGFPTAAISLVRRRADVLDMCLLGDAPVVFAGAGPTVFTDPQYDTVEQELLSTVRADLDRGDSPATAYGRIHAILLDHRARRNTEAGSWILGDVPEAARHARSLSVPLSGVGDVLICSDGFGRLVEPFGLVDGYGALLAAVRAGAAEHLVARLREAELADPDRVRYPRFGVSDDASVLHAVLEPVGQAKGTTTGTRAAVPLQ